MLLYRFMGQAEYDKYLAGKTLVNEKNWSKNCRTSSKGFCFMPLSSDKNSLLRFEKVINGDWGMKTKVSADPYIRPDEAYWILGDRARDAFVCCIFEIKDRDVKKAGLKKGYGYYAVPEELFPGVDHAAYPLMGILEYSTTEYSRETLRLVSAIRMGGGKKKKIR